MASPRPWQRAEVQRSDRDRRLDYIAKIDRLHDDTEDVLDDTPKNGRVWRRLRVLDAELVKTRDLLRALVGAVVLVLGVPTPGHAAPPAEEQFALPAPEEFDRQCQTDVANFVRDHRFPGTTQLQLARQVEIVMAALGCLPLDGHPPVPWSDR